MPNRDQSLRTIKSIHAAGLDDALRPQALDGVTRLYGVVGTTLEIFYKSRQHHRLDDALGHRLGVAEQHVGGIARGYRS